MFEYLYNHFNNNSETYMTNLSNRLSAKEELKEEYFYILDNRPKEELLEWIYDKTADTESYYNTKRNLISHELPILLGFKFITKDELVEIEKEWCISK